MSLVKRQKNEENGEYNSFEIQTFSLQGHKGTVLASKFSKDGSIIASGGVDQKIHLWNLPHHSSTETPNFGEITGHKSAITSLRWLSNGQLASSSADTTVGLWDTETGKRLRKFASHSLVVNEIDVDSNLISSAADDGVVHIWDERSKSPINSFETEFPLLTVSFHKNIVYASGIEPVIRAWDVRSPSSPVFTLETQHTDSITSLSVDDSNLISRSQDSTIRIYDPNVVSTTRIRPGIYAGASSGSENLLIRSILRNNTIYSGSSDKTVTSWDVTSRRLLRKLSGHSGTVIDVDEHEGKICSTSVDGDIILRYTNA